MNPEELIKEVALARIVELGGFLVSIRIHPNHKVILEFDKQQGVNVSDCASISRTLENDPRLLTFFESHGLEVSSPGLDSPFRVHEQYLNNVGRKVKVKIIDEGETSGKLISVESNGISIEPFTEKNKPAPAVRFIPFTSIRETRKVISFS